MDRCAGRGADREIVSQPLLCLFMWTFSHFFRHVEITHILDLFAGNVVLYVAVGLVCLWEEVSSGSSFGACLNQNLTFVLGD